MKQTAERWTTTTLLLSSKMPTMMPSSSLKAVRMNSLLILLGLGLGALPRLSWPCGHHSVIDVMHTSSMIWAATKKSSPYVIKVSQIAKRLVAVSSKRLARRAPLSMIATRVPLARVKEVASMLASVSLLPEESVRITRSVLQRFLFGQTALRVCGPHVWPLPVGEKVVVVVATKALLDSCIFSCSAVSVANAGRHFDNALR